jgi:hypothetical protein
MKFVPSCAQACLPQQAVAQADDFLVAKVLQPIGQATDAGQEADHGVSCPSGILDGFHQIHQPATLGIYGHPGLMCSNSGMHTLYSLDWLACTLL